MVGFVFFQLRQQALLSNVLDARINGGVHIKAVHGLHSLWIINGLPIPTGNLLLQTASRFTLQVFAVIAFQASTGSFEIIPDGTHLNVGRHLYALQIFFNDNTPAVLPSF